MIECMVESCNCTLVTLHNNHIFEKATARVLFVVCCHEYSSVGSFESAPMRLSSQGASLQREQTTTMLSGEALDHSCEKGSVAISIRFSRGTHAMSLEGALESRYS
jgi:hypothetical protein